MVPLLIVAQLHRLGKGHNRDRNRATLEIGLASAHLAEVGLTGQSGEMAKKNDQEIVLKIGAEVDRIIPQIDQRQPLKGDFIHS